MGEEVKKGPGERDTSEVSEEERGVAEWGEESAGVTDGEDEEKNDMFFRDSGLIGLDNGLDEEHRSACCSDEAGKDSSDDEDSGIKERCTREGAFDDNGAGDSEEGSEEEDERDIGLDFMDGIALDLRVEEEEADNEHRKSEDKEADDPIIFMPEFRSEEWEDSD